MAEQTLNSALSGAEIIEALVDKLRSRLQTDCYLNPNSAYDYFSGKITVELVMHDAGADVRLEKVAELTTGEEPVDREVETVESVVELTPAPPNQVRVDSGQGVPVATKGEHGESVIKKVRYGRGKGGRG